MRFTLGILAAVLLGLAIGGASALVLAGLWPRGAHLAATSAVEVDGWRSDFAIGSDAADPYTRARIARHGLLALAQSEAVYFTRSVDDSGRPLSEDCVYELSGEGQPARWWSITLYDGDSRLPMNRDEALSIDASETGEEAWRAIIAPVQPHQNFHWISSRNARDFDLTLRLYVPDDTVFNAPSDAFNPPAISRMGCYDTRDGGP